MPRIFISYRRGDSEASAGRLYDRLRDRFGFEPVFRDRESIALGADFAEVIAKELSSCDVLLAVIGKQWLTLEDDQGRRRLDDPKDFVVREIATALERGSEIRVIPVLVDGALMPDPEVLPAALSGLADCQALELSHDRWDDDFSRLAKALQPRWRRPLVAVLAVVALTALALWAYKEVFVKPPVIGVLPFTYASGSQEANAKDLVSLLDAWLGCCDQVEVVPRGRMEAIDSAAPNDGEIREAAAAQKIDYLLAGEILANGDVEVRVSSTRNRKRFDAELVPGLTQANLSEKSRQIASFARKLMGLPSQITVGVWQADFHASDPEAYHDYIKGLEALRAESYQDAQEYFSRALSSAPDYEMARYHLAWAYAYDSDMEKALEELGKMSKAFRSSASREARYIQAAEHYFSGHEKAALDAYRELIKDHPSDVEPRQQVAEILIASGDYNTALATWEEIGRLGPQADPLEVGRRRAEIYLMKEDVDKALKILERLIEDSPQDAVAHGLLGSAHQAQHNLKSARDEYDKVLELNPYLYRTLLSKSDTYVLEGDLDQAIKTLDSPAFEEASAKDQIDASFQLAYLLMAVEQFREGAQILELQEKEIVAEKERVALALSIRGLCAMEAGDLRTAGRLIQEAIRRAPPEYPARHLFARGLLELRRCSLAEARKTADEIRGLAGSVADENRAEDKAAAYLTGMALLAEGRAEEAIQPLSRAVALHGTEFQIYRAGLARAYRMAGRLDEALAAAEKASQHESFIDVDLALELDRRRTLLLIAQIESERRIPTDAVTKRSSSCSSGSTLSAVSWSLSGRP